MIWPGLQLLLVGGTAYYLVAGVLMLASGVDLIRGATRGFYTFAVLLLLTLIWAVSEAGSDFLVRRLAYLDRWLAVSLAVYPLDSPQALGRQHPRVVEYAHGSSRHSRIGNGPAVNGC